MQHRLNPLGLSRPESLKTLVENRTAYTLQSCELNVFETYTESYTVPLVFNDFVITSMLRGKKVMHLSGRPEFEYYPGQTVIVPARLSMNIDFPEATDENPTQCIALAIDSDQIKKTIRYLNEFFPKEGSLGDWELKVEDDHFQNSEDITALINKIVNLCAERSGAIDVLADLTLKELLVRIMQKQNLKALGADADHANRNPLGYVLHYIKANLNEKININSLTDKACMSKATFYRLFKRELGLSPNEFILSEKITKAKQLLSNPKAKVAAVSYELGFSDANYFIRAFKKLVGMTPGHYQLQVNSRFH